jgi:hypothetical protein
MGLAGLIGTGGPGGCGEQNPLDTLAYTMYICKVGLQAKSPQSVWWMDQALLCATSDGIRMEWRRRNAEKDGRRRRGG